MPDKTLLDVKSVETGYGKKQVLFGATVSVGQQQVVGLIGPNGAGKSTLLRSIFGLLPVWSGEIRLNGELVNGCTPGQNVISGMTYCPQGLCVFSELTVMENLELGAFQLRPQEQRQRMDEVLELFPQLTNKTRRQAGALSGGEQQMLAVARALIGKPRLLMLDEPSLGLAPGVVSAVFEKIRDISEDSGLAVLIVEQKVPDVLAICHKVYSLKLGHVIFGGSPDELRNDRSKLQELFL